MSKISVTTIAGLTSGGDANKVKIESGDTFEALSNATVGGTLGVDGHASIGNSTTIAGTRALTVVGASDGSGSTILNCYNSSLASKFSVRDDGIINAANLILAPTGIRIGGSGTGNTLDDYEEGTWTPQLRAGGTDVGTTVHQGFYTKIGNVVHCEFNIQRNDSATNNNNMEMTGLPFPHRTIPSTVGQAWIDNTSGDVRCFIYLPSDSSKIYYIDAGDNDSYVNMNEFDNGRYIYAAFTYMTDS